MTSRESVRVRPAIPRTIWALGFVSLFTDLGSEMVHSLLPILLATGLGASALSICQRRFKSDPLSRKIAEVNLTHLGALDRAARSRRA